jgi:transposase-like protein
MSKKAGKKSFSETVKAKAVQMMLEGNTPQKEIAKKIGCSPAALQQWKRAAKNKTVVQEEYAEPEVKEVVKKPVVASPSPKNGSPDDFIRKFWNKNYRGVDMLLTPKSATPEEVVKLVNEALLFAYEQLQK